MSKKGLGALGEHECNSSWALIITFSFQHYCGAQIDSAITLEGEVWMAEAQRAHTGPFLMWPARAVAWLAGIANYYPIEPP